MNVQLLVIIVGHVSKTDLFVAKAARLTIMRRVSVRKGTLLNS